MISLKVIKVNPSCALICKLRPYDFDEAAFSCPIIQTSHVDLDDWTVRKNYKYSESVGKKLPREKYAECDL